MLASLKNLSPQWWGAIAAAVAAGASVLSDHRILGGLAAGGAMLYLAKKASEPCCAGCAGETTVKTEAQGFDVGELFGSVAAKLQAPSTSSSCPGCAEGLFS